MSSPQSISLLAEARSEKYVAFKSPKGLAGSYISAVFTFRISETVIFFYQPWAEEEEEEKEEEVREGFSVCRRIQQLPTGRSVKVPLSKAPNH